MIDNETLSDWRINYELHRDPHDLAEFWRGGVPAGAVLALKAAVEQIERLQTQLAEVVEALKEVVDAADGEGWEQLDPSFKKQRAALVKARGE